MPKKPTAAYLRLSMMTDDSTSIAAQRGIIQRKADERGLGRIVWFEDEGVSGSKDVKRPQRDAMERRLLAGEFGALIVKSVDRLARSTADFTRIAGICKQTGTDLIVSDLGVDTTTPGGDLVLQILAALAQFEARLIGTRVKQGNTEKIQSGRAIGGPVPYGFRNVKRPGQRGTYRAMDPEQSVIVRRIAEHIVAGGSFSGIAKALNREDVPTPRAAERIARGKPSLPGPVAPWTYMTVRRVLSTPAIAGQIVFRDDVVRDADGMPTIDPTLAIVTEAEYETIRNRLSANSGERRSTSPRGEAERLLLEGVAVCAHCERPLKRHRAGRPGKTQYEYLRCLHGCKKAASVTATAIERYVVGEILERFGDTEVIERRETADPEKVARLATARREAERAQEAMLHAEVAERPEHFAQWHALTARVTELEVDVLDAVTLLVPTGRTLSDLWGEYDHVARRALLRDMLAKVAVAYTGGDRSTKLASRVRIVLREDDDATILADIRRHAGGESAGPKAVRHAETPRSAGEEPAQVTEAVTGVNTYVLLFPFKESQPREVTARHTSFDL